MNRNEDACSVLTTDPHAWGATRVLGGKMEHCRLAQPPVDADGQREGGDEKISPEVTTREGKSWKQLVSK